MGTCQNILLGGHQSGKVTYILEKNSFSPKHPLRSLSEYQAISKGEDRTKSEVALYLGEQITDQHNPSQQERHTRPQQKDQTEPQGGQGEGLFQKWACVVVKSWDYGSKLPWFQVLTHKHSFSASFSSSK